MTIYIDRAGHMVTDGPIDTLHQFANLLGLKRSWFQDHPKHPHYDLTTRRKITQAQRAGAKMIPSKQMVRLLRGDYG